VSLQGNIVVRRIANARSLKLRIQPNGSVLLVAPKLTPKYILDRFIEENSEWIATNQQVAIKSLEDLTNNREELFYRGSKKQFRLAVSSSVKPKVELVKDCFIVTSRSEDHSVIRSLLEKWYRTEAKKYLIDRAQLLADLVNVEIKGISIRSGRTRWGSCTSRQTLSLNWRLIMAPEWVSDYVIYHELAHLTHLNHSKAFWDLVNSYFPRHQQAKLWLSEHHKLLHF